jgi:hypothetical protein
MNRFNIFPAVWVIACTAALAACSALPCDSTEAQAMLQDALADGNHHEIATSVSQIGTASHSILRTACTAHVATTDGEETDLSYSISVRHPFSTELNITGSTRDAPRCDAAAVQSDLRHIISSHSQNVQITSLTNIATTSHERMQAACTAHYTAAQGPPGDVRYNFYMQGDRAIFDAYWTPTGAASDEHSLASSAVVPQLPAWADGVVQARQGWTFINADETAVVFMQRAPGLRRALVREEWVTRSREGAVSYVVLREFDCVGVRERSVQATGYPLHNMGGHGRDAQPSSVWRQVGLGTVDGEVLRRVCTGP